MAVFENVDKEEFLSKIKKLDFSEEETKNIYESWRGANEKVSLILYSSGKLLLQGKKKDVQETAESLNKLGLGEEAKSQKFRQEKGWVIGSDESLKGDTFGGLVVAAVKADEDTRKKLLEIGVADSKTLYDNEIIALAEKIKKIASCEIRSILPEEYNHQPDITSLLNKLHQECAEYLHPGAHVVDKYPGCNVGDIREEKAEAKFAEVAAASILAREAALQQLNYLSRMAGFTLPKGSAHVSSALKELKDRELKFNLFVKMNFNNVKEFLKNKAFF